MAGDSSSADSFHHPWDSFLLKLSTPPAPSYAAPSNDAPHIQNPNPGITKTFAKVLSDSIDQQISFTNGRDTDGRESDVIVPVKKGDYYSIIITESLYQEQIKTCEASLIGRLVLAKGDKPWRFDDLKLKLQQLWNPSQSWLMTSLGKGFYCFRFA